MVLYRSYNSSSACSSPAAIRSRQDRSASSATVATRSGRGLLVSLMDGCAAQGCLVHPPRWRRAARPRRRQRRAATRSADAVASMTTNRSGACLAIARNPWRTRRWKSRSNSASKRVTSPGALRARPVSTGRSSTIVRSGVSPSVAMRASVPSVAQIDARAVPLVGHGRVGEPGADHGRAGLERRSDDLADELTASCIEQQRIGQRIRRGRGRAAVAGPCQEHLPESLAKPGAAGLARQVDATAGRLEVSAEPVRLGGLATALGTLDGDEGRGRRRG